MERVKLQKGGRVKLIHSDKPRNPTTFRSSKRVALKGPYLSDEQAALVEDYKNTHGKHYDKRTIKKPKHANGVIDFADFKSNPKRAHRQVSTYADPRAYNNERHPRQVYQLRLMGMKAKHIADVFLVGEKTLYTWRLNFPDFNRAWIEGGEGADAIVAESLFRRAIGWQHTDEKVQIMADGSVVRVPITQKFAPDVTAATFWLTNRQGGVWQAKNSVNMAVSRDAAKDTVPTIIINPVAALNGTAPVIDGRTFNEVPTSEQFADDDDV